jgi:hypothetical protein
MNKLKLIALCSLLSAFFLTACESDDDTRLDPDYSRYISNYDFFLTGAQQIPANTSTASGRIEGTYDRRTKTYTYKLTWAGLSSAVTSIHIHGIADKGYIALPTPLGLYANGIVQTAFGNATATSGTYSGSLYVDGSVIREADLLANKFYVDIHTTNFPGGEIRAQLNFP